MCHLLCFEARCNPADEGGRGGMQAGASHYLVVSAKNTQDGSGYRSAVDAAIRPKTIPGMLAAAKGKSRCFLNKP